MHDPRVWTPPPFSSHSVVQSMNLQISQSLSGKSMMLLPNIVLPNFVSSFCFQKIFTEISCYFPSSDNERPGSRHCRSLLLEERIPELWCLHYHVLLWIRDAPVIALSRRGSPAAFLMRTVVLSCTGWLLDSSCTSVASTDFIQERITCSIPDEDGSPELHRLVAR